MTWFDGLLIAVLLLVSSVVVGFTVALLWPGHKAAVTSQRAVPKVTLIEHKRKAGWK